MNKPVLGMAIGGGLGVIDGLSAFGYPEARPMIAAIVAGSVLKGIVTGLAVGTVARWRRSIPLGLTVGVVVGMILSSLAATVQPDHYWAIVLPGMLVGALAGYLTQRYESTGAVTLACVLLIAGGPNVAAHAPAAANGLAPLEYFLGQWEGTAEGQPGKGTVTREYTALLRSRIIQARHRGVYPPQAANPQGEVHEDTGIYSFDEGVKRIRFRQFHVEGFVVHYVLEPQTKPGTFVFASQAIENIPAGYRSRETHVVLGPDEFEEVFELAEPGKQFEAYSRTRLTRVK